MLGPNERSLILLYYDIRGKGQVIRSLLCYLEAPYVEVHLEAVEAGTEKPDETVLARLRNRPIDRSRLPLLVDGEDFIYGTFAINMHLCRRSGRLDLFGRNQQQMVPRGAIQSEVYPILQKLLENQIKCKAFLLEFAEKCSNKTDREVKQLIHLTYENVMNNSHYVREICELLESQGKDSFIFGSLTIVDFYFLQTCFYILGFFGSVDREYSRSFESFYNSIVSTDLRRKSNKMYLQVMRKFVAKMCCLPFYRKHKEYLESFTLIFRQMSKDRMDGLRKIWVGHPKHVQ